MVSVMKYPSDNAGHVVENIFYDYHSQGQLNSMRNGANYYVQGTTYDAENHLTNVSGDATAEFKYDGDGNRVKATIGSAITVCIGNYFEWTGSTSKLIKYFYAGTQRIAMKQGSLV